MKHLVATCINGFDEDGDCIIPGLPWSHVSDMANAEENSAPLEMKAFLAQANVPPEIKALVKKNRFTVHRCEDGTDLLYDTSKDVHYIFVEDHSPKPVLRMTP